MSPAEIGYRVLRAVQARAERSRLARERRRCRAPDLAHSGTPWIHADARRRGAARYIAAADRIADGWLDVFALRDVDLGSPPRWNRDPKTGIEAPLDFGKLLDYRDPDVVGDIKYLWEPNRHLHLVTLAQAYALTRQAQVLRRAAEQLDSWFLACPYGVGPNWSSALEAARAADQLVGGLAAARRCPRKIRRRQRRSASAGCASIYQHAEFIARLVLAALLGQQPPDRRGRGPVHRRAHLAALARARAWRETAQGDPRARGAGAERARRREPRAVGAPTSSSCSTCCSLSLLAGTRATAQRFSPAYESRVEAMLDFLASIMDAGGNVPMFGDADDGCVLRLDARRGIRRRRSLLATGAVLFRRGDFKLQGAAALDDSTRWLLGAQRRCASSPQLDAEQTRLPLRQAFPEGGYFVLGCDFDTPREIRLVADAGPLGYRAIAAHGHADALSFTLSAGGREFLVDPGTYAYHTQPAWRHYFRGTARAQHGAHRRPRPVGVRRQLHVAAQGARGLQPVALRRRQGQLRGLARRLHAPRRPGEAPAPDRARQARAPR